MSKTYRIAVIPGDGIGKETVPESLRVLDAAARRFNFSLKLDEYDWSCETYKKTGAMMPADGMDRLKEADSILLGAVGFPGVPDHVSLWGLLIPIRRGFDQYVNLRPCKLMPGVRTPLANRTEADIDPLRGGVRVDLCGDPASHRIQGRQLTGAWGNPQARASRGDRSGAPRGHIGDAHGVIDRVELRVDAARRDKRRGRPRRRHPYAAARRRDPGRRSAERDRAQRVQRMWIDPRDRLVVEVRNP